MTSAGFRDERRALPQQVVAAFGARIERGARHGEHFAVLFERKACGDQRAGALGKSRNPNGVVRLKDLESGEEVVIAFEAAQQ
jgi:hypothetical protein